MVEISIAGETVTLEVQGWDKLWSLKSRLEIPLTHIRGVRAAPEVARGWWHGTHALGTYVPGVLTAGTLYRHGKWAFWDVHDPERTIVIDLVNEHYDELVVEVANPSVAVGLLQRNIRKRTA